MKAQIKIPEGCFEGYCGGCFLQKEMLQIQERVQPYIFKREKFSVQNMKKYIRRVIMDIIALKVKFLLG